MLIAIDPGVHRCACAVFHGGKLQRVGYDLIVAADDAVVEKPQFDARNPSRVIDLAYTGALHAGRCVAAGGTVTGVEPRRWKGSVPKPVHHRLLWTALTRGEHAKLPGGTADRIHAACKAGALDAWRRPGVEYYGRANGSDVHNLLDAVGLGLWHLGRI